MSSFPFLAQRLFNRPLAIHPRKAEIIVAALAERLGVVRVAGLEDLQIGADALGIEADFEREGRTVRADTGYDLVEGLAIVPVKGTLVHKLGTLRPYSGMTGYDGIRQTFLTALGDPEVKAIVLDVDSPGGEVSGMFDLADEIFSARGEKPIAAIVDDASYSAAYLVTSAVDPGRVYVPRTGGTGSIGIIAAHCDMSRAYDKAGLNVTIISKGARKADFRPEIPLSEEALAAAQAEINEMGAMFDDAVARNRGLKASVVSGFEAGTFMGAHGVTAGLADACMSPDAAFRALLNELAV